MKRFWLLPVCMLGLMVTSGVCAQGDFESIFNGRDLTGWAGRTDLWKVEDGMIVGSTHDHKIDRNTFLIWQGGKPGDFVLRAKMKFEEANSGIQYRSVVDDDKQFFVSGNQCDLHPKAEYYGMLYSEKTGLGIVAQGGQKVEVGADGKKKVVGKTEGPTTADTAGWNDIEIHAEGNHLIHKVNGKVTVDVTGDHETITRAGVIAFQLHVGKPMKVWIKDVQIKKLDVEPQVLTTPVDQIRVPDGFKVELVYTVPRETQGSWVALTAAPDGSLIASDQSDAGLFRVKPSKIGDGQKGTTVSKINVPISNARGMCVAFNALYVMRSDDGNGLWRVTDSTGDGRYDKAEQLFAINGSTEHGPHAVIPDIDGKSLLICSGNAAAVPPDLTHSAVPRVWGEDQLLPRQPDGNGHARGRLAPGGWVARISPDGKQRSLLTVGYRNEYDIAQNRAGDIFTFDADMEWDFGQPWYRPTRICESMSGVDFGWRNGSGKWPEYSADSMRPVVNIGPASPTGVLFAYDAKFPVKYRESLIFLDWTYGTIWSGHLSPEKGAYKATFEPFVGADALPVTDAAVGADGALYFAVGGRKIQSALYRVIYVGSEPTDAPVPVVQLTPERQLRRDLEAFHGVVHAKAVEVAWAQLGHDDATVRHAARIALESQPVDQWRVRVLDSSSTIAPRAMIHAAIALARHGAVSDRTALVERLASIDVVGLSEDEQLEYLRAVSLAFIRLTEAAEGKEVDPDAGAPGRPTEAERKMLLAKINPLFPSTDARVNRELATMLIYLEAPKIAGRVLDHMAALPPQTKPDWASFLSRNDQYGNRASKMLSDMPPTEGMHYAFVLRNLKKGWTLDQRKTYFQFLIDASKKPGGASFANYLKHIREEALANCTPAQRVALVDLASVDLNRTPDFKIHPPKGPGRMWTLEESVKAVNQVKLKKRDFKQGRNLFFATGCAACHRFDGFGGAIGPDLTSAGGKLDLKNLLEAVIDPSKAISDQYGSSVIARNDGATLMGLVVDNDANNAEGELLIFTHDPNAAPVRVSKKSVKSVTPSPVSQMPPALINTLNAQELADLVAYLLSGGNDRHGYFR